MREQGLFGLEKTAAEAPNSSPQYLQGGQQGDGARSFAVLCGRKRGGGGLKLKKGEIQSFYKEKKKKKNHCEDNHPLEIFKT